MFPIRGGGGVGVLDLIALNVFEIQDKTFFDFKRFFFEKFQF